MSRTMFTPGPWETREGFMTDTIEVFKPNPSLQPPFTPTEIAVVGDTENPDEDEANARLIAAAPDMLDLLRRIHASAQYWSEYDVPLGLADDIAEMVERFGGIGEDE